MNRSWRTRRLFHLRRPKPSRAVDLEIRHHLNECVDFLVAQGLSREMALREALRRFGNVERVRRTCEDITQDAERGMKRAEVFSSLVQDFVYALRGIRKNPIFAAALTLTLGLGIGANTAIFTVVDAILLRPLPYERPEELVSFDPLNQAQRSTIPFAAPEMARAWIRETDFVDHLSLYRLQSVIRLDGNQPMNAAGQAVTLDLATLLGVTPVLGRWFVEEDMVPGATPVVILGHHKWREWFDEDPDVLGRSVVLSEIPHVVIGIMPAEFRFPRVGASDLYVPFSNDDRAVGTQIQRARVIGRLSAGLRLEAADERAKRLAEGLGILSPSYASFNTIQVSRHTEWRANPEVHQALWTLSVAVVLMWLIAVGNGVNLLSVRASARSREMALRLSLGASRLRLLRQLLTESLTLALLGGIAAMLLARVSMVTIVGLIPDSVVTLSANEIVLGDRVLWFAFSLSTITGLVVGLLPAIRLLRGSGSTSVSAMDLHHSSKGTATGTRRALVVVEVGLSMTLLVGAGLVVNSFNRLVRVEPGFEMDNLLFLSVSLPVHMYQTGAAREDFFTRLETRIGAIPGVQAATLAQGVPPTAGFSFGLEITAEGDPAPLAEQPYWVPVATVEGDFFDLMGIPLIAGRTFDATDDLESRTVMVDVDMARFIWGDDNPMGRRFRLNSDSDWYTVIGVVGDVKLRGQDDRRGNFEMYRPRTGSSGYMSLAIRTRADVENVMPVIRAAVWELDANLPIHRLETAGQALADSVEGPRFLVTLLTVAAAIGLALVAIGVYGVLSFAVSQRTRELGVRIALGATAPNVQSMVLKDGMILAAMGVVLGLAGAVALSRVIQELLFHVEPTDPFTLAGVSAVMLVTAGVACYLPARKATKVDPMIVLRAE